MIKSRKFQLVIVLIIAVITSFVLGQEPNLIKEELQFRIGQEEQKWITDLDEHQGIYPEDRTEKSVIKPTHVSIMIIEHTRVPRIYWTEISNNPIGRTMSKQQQEFIAEANGRIRNLTRKEEGFEFRWYAVSQEDAQKMAQTFINVWKTKVDKKLQPFLNRRKELGEKINEIKKMLPVKQKNFEAAESKYKEIKNARYFSSLDDGEVYTKAKDTMFQMDKMLDVLEIELAGINSKLKEIESFRRTKRLPGKDLSDETVDKLDQMFIEQIVELQGAEARKKAALGIQHREKEFVDLFNQWINHEREVHELKQDLEMSENNLRSVEEILDNPKPEMLPPKVFQNKVTIYPVK
jgi:hypothetical protein